MTALITVILPLVGAGVALANGWARRRIGVIVTLTLAATLLIAILAAVTESALQWSWSRDIDLGIEVTGFGRVMLVLVPLIALPVVGYAAATEAEGRTRLIVLMLAFVSAMLLLVAAADFITLIIGWELVSAMSWALIGHRWADPSVARSAAQAFVTTRLGDIGLFVAAGATFAATRSFAFDALERAPAAALAVVAGGVVLAAAAKSAQVPFSPWLFAAMAGPTPVSALLHSATLVAAGAYLLIRLGPDLAVVAWFAPLVAGIGLVTAIMGGIVAFLQTDAKSALAGSTSAQYGFMFVAIGAGSTAAAGAHLVAHATLKSLLFLAAGVAIHATGSGWLGGMRLGRALPRLAVISGIGALALAGVPPLGAAWTKERMLSAAVEQSALLAAGFLLASLLSVLYAVRYQLLAYGRPSTHERPPTRTYRAARAEVAWPATLAVVTLVLSLAWLPGAGALVEAATAGRLVAAAAWELPVTLAIIVGGFAIVWLTPRPRLVTLGLPDRVRGPAAEWLWLPLLTDALVVRPVRVLAAALARLDDRVVDAGIRAVGWLALRASGLFARRGEWTFDGIVGTTAALTLAWAQVSRHADDRGVDGAVEASARGVGAAGESSRRLQTGQSHHYFVIIGVGLAIMLIVVLWSS